MGTPRQPAESQPTQKQPTPQEDAALVIFAILSGQAIFPNPEEIVTAALLALVPTSLPLRDDISAQAARLVLTDPPDTPKGSGALSAANRENLKYRVAYGFEAIQRLTKAVRGPGDEIGERLDKALRAEKSYLTAHINAGKRRLQTAEMIERAVATYGPVLSWRAVKRSTSRHHHLTADGRNWNASNGPPRATGALPGVLPNCLCSFGPPIPGAPLMV